LAVAVSDVFAQPPGPLVREPAFELQGDSALAEQYLLWAEQAVSGGRLTEALTALERAADFADVSSDLSYLLALVRSRKNKSRGAVLQALDRAIRVGRWSRYSESKARLLEAEQFIALRGYFRALASLARTDASADAAVLRLAALRGLAASGVVSGTGGFPASVEFRRRVLETMDRYPRDPRPLRILFDYAKNKTPEEGDRVLIELALRRLPFLIETDPDLGWMAAPFIHDTEEARRLVSAYRAGSLKPYRDPHFRPHPASIAVALHLELISEEMAIEEFFSPPPDSAGMVIDKDLILAFSSLLQGEAEQNLFMEKLLSFTGTIIADEDHDGCLESRIVYHSGIMQEYSHDADQDGLADLFVVFNAGSPQWAEQALPPGDESGQAAFSALPLGNNERPRALIFWERYPAVQRAALEETVYTPAPGKFDFSPFSFVELAGSGSYAGLLYPVLEPQSDKIDRQSLVSFAASIQRPSMEFDGAIEWIYLERGLPYRAEEILNGRIVSETVFENGIPLLQRLDMDTDSRLETVRRFRRTPRPGQEPLNFKEALESSESDWNGDGFFESGEVYLEDGSVVYSLDIDGDGSREYSEIKNEK
jgi:hypothetical protein